MGMIPEVIFFDFDGVLANSDVFNLCGLELAATQLKLPFREQDFRSHFAGKRLRDGASSYLEMHGKIESLEVFLEEKYKFDSSYLDYCVPYPVATAITKLLSNHYKLILVSGSRRTLVDQFLDYYKLSNCFKDIVTGEDVVSGKPSPAPYIEAMKKAGVSNPDNSLAIEDSPAGILSAKSAGLRCLAVCQTHSATLLRGADSVIPSLAEVIYYLKLNNNSLPVDLESTNSATADDDQDEGLSSNQVEILQVSSLEDFPWPDSDPHSTLQPTRNICSEDIVIMRECAQASSLDISQFRKNARKQNWNIPKQILAILSHQKFQMNPAKAVREEPAWNRSVTLAISQNRPIELVYPQFCVIPNAPKRYTNIGPSAGEDCTIEFIKHVNDHVKQIYAPGIIMHALADASLYASAFQTHQTEVDTYFSELAGRIKELGASDIIQLHDYSDLLRQRCNPEYQILYYKIGQSVWAGPIESLLPNTDIPTLRRSVRCSINTRRFQLSHKEHLSLFGPLDQRDINHSLLSTIDQMTEIALREVITIRLACGEIDIASRLWPDAIRASCHKGQKNGRWPIGLKTYPEYYGSCKLLPYHGMPIINTNSKGKLKMTIEPEVKLRSRNDLVRVMSSSDEVYFYIHQDIHEKRFDGVQVHSKKGMRSTEMGELI
ncbi:MAG: HAD-IA family hydrolase [Planctomycetota bacterium]